MLGQTDFGIGVSAGRAIAGHIGAQARFEYTVIGDPVNEAARLTELAKLEGGHVLASAIAVSGALDAEALCWNVGEIVELRGRRAPTQLARPMNLVLPECGQRDRHRLAPHTEIDEMVRGTRTFAPICRFGPRGSSFLGGGLLARRLLRGALDRATGPPIGEQLRRPARR